jgi:putative colanic acid biosynthesis UDP-glucose lipid carrier transferase
MNILRRHATLFNTFQRMLDIAVLLVITWLAEKQFNHPDLARIFMIYGSLITAVVFSFLGIYKSWRGFSIFDQIKNLLFAWLSVLIVFNIIILLLSNKQQLDILWPFALFRSSDFLLWAVLIFIGLTFERGVVKVVLAVMRRRGYNQRSAYIVGAGEAGKKLGKFLIENKWLGIKLKGFFEDELDEGEVVTGSSSMLASVLGSVEKCSELAVSNRIDIVFIALSMRAEEKINKLIWDLGTKGVSVLMVQDLFTLGVQRAKTHHMGELHLLDFNIFPAWKRTFDIIFPLLIIIITLPFWLIIMLCIKIEDGGPIFYKDPRVGECGKRFKCLKFRTMHIDAAQRLKSLLEQDSTLREEYEKTYKLKNDPRVTKIGRFLRRTSLDELPQFLNVLAGDMSVVGARPVLPVQFETHYKDIALTYCATKPGLTGLWQTGKRSDTGDYAERVELDRWYVLNSSILLDIKIIFKTIWRIIRPKGAY